MRNRVEAEFSKAETAIEDAKTLREGGGSDGAIVNRLYYACFHAAQAALYSKAMTRALVLLSLDCSVGRSYNEATPHPPKVSF
jgi:predicted TIM-barrel enzyme